jgi:hypothetical protein
MELNPCYKRMKMGDFETPVLFLGCEVLWAPGKV